MFFFFFFKHHSFSFFFRAGLSLNPLDKNAATHLIRGALNSQVYVSENMTISDLLSLPQSMVRFFRDDITVTVIYFDSEFLRNYPGT